MTMTIGKKITFGFGGLLALTAIVGGVAVINMNNCGTSAKTLATEFAPESKIAGNFSSAMTKAQLAIRTYGLTADAAYLAEARTALVELRKHLGMPKRFPRSMLLWSDSRRT